MQCAIKNRLFKISFNKELLVNNISTMSFILLAFWWAWEVKSFSITIFNFDLETWNPTNKFTKDKTDEN